jgi:7-keto-8-aminopelargonate synthetase-like enzyme
MASFGGFVAGDRNIIEYLRHHARTMIFSAALPPASAAAALAALRVMKEDQTLFDRLWENIHFFRQEISRIGYCITNDKEDSPDTPLTAIVPLFVGSESLAFRLCREALDMGVFATPAVYPAVPYGQSVIRTSLTPAHTRQHLLQALNVFAKLIQKYPQARVDIQNLPKAQEIDYTYLFSQP